MSSQLIVVDDNEKETKETKRKRLAGEFRFLTQQLNSKLTEMLNEGMTVVLKASDGNLWDHGALIHDVAISYQTPPKQY